MSNTTSYQPQSMFNLEYCKQIQQHGCYNPLQHIQIAQNLISPQRCPCNIKRSQEGYFVEDEVRTIKQKLLSKQNHNDVAFVSQLSLQEQVEKINQLRWRNKSPVPEVNIQNQVLLGKNDFVSKQQRSQKKLPYSECNHLQSANVPIGMYQQMQTQSYIPQSSSNNDQNCQFFRPLSPNAMIEQIGSLAQGLDAVDIKFAQKENKNAQDMCFNYPDRTYISQKQAQNTNIHAINPDTAKYIMLNQNTDQESAYQNSSSNIQPQDHSSATDKVISDKILQTTNFQSGTHEYQPQNYPILSNQTALRVSFAVAQSQTEKKQLFLPPFIGPQQFLGKQGAFPQEFSYVELPGPQTLSKGCLDSAGNCPQNGTKANGYPGILKSNENPAELEHQPQLKFDLSADRFSLDPKLTDSYYYRQVYEELMSATRQVEQNRLDVILRNSLFDLVLIASKQYQLVDKAY